MTRGPALLALALLSACPALADDAPARAGWEQAADEVPEIKQWGRLGLFEVRDPFITALARHSPWARSPQTLGHLELETALRVVWANSYGFRKNRAVLDAETRTFTLSLRLGIMDRLELGLHLPYEWRGGGVMDEFIEGFHDAFGLPEQSRDKRPRDRFLVTGTESDGSPYALDHPGYGLGDMTVEVRGLLSEGDLLLPAATLTLRLRLPTGRPKFDNSDGVDVSLTLDASKRLPGLPLVVYASLAYTYYAESLVNSLELMRHRLYFAAGFEWELAEWVSLVAHVWIESRRETELWDESSNLTVGNLTYGNYVSYVAAGFKFSPTEGLSLEVAILENLIDPDVTADLGWLLNAVWRF